jgi:hypothetical protein
VIRLKLVAFLGTAVLTGGTAVALTDGDQPAAAGITSAGIRGQTVTDLRWLPSTLRAAGLTVVEEVGWVTRGHPTPLRARAVVLHHDASTPGPTPGAVKYLVDGYGSGVDRHYDAQVWVDRAGTWHMVAAGAAQHAGPGTGWGAIRPGLGNQDSFGVETDHTVGEAWPPKQLASIRRGLAAICARLGWDPTTTVVGHKEYAPGRKQDPAGIDMSQLRRAVTDLVPVVGDVLLARVARAAGCWKGPRLQEVAVALAESRGRPQAVGDVRLQDRVGGPSIGLWQIRSLRAERGKGTQRDQAVNGDPVVNAKYACQIWRDRGWAPWSTWRNGTYRKYLGRARTALAA